MKEAVVSLTFEPPWKRILQPRGPMPSVLGCGHVESVLWKSTLWQSIRVALLTESTARVPEDS